MSQYEIIRKNCKNKKNVFYFSVNLNSNVFEIARKLRCSEYYFSHYNIFLIKEKKYRIIMSECMSDKIVSHFLSNFCLKEILDKKMIHQNVATRKNLGGKAAYDNFYKYIHSIGLDKEIFVLKIDISKYFYNINHLILKQMLSKDIKDKFALKLLCDIIDSTDYDYVNKKIDTLINNEKKRIIKLKVTDKNRKNLFNELDKIPRYKKGKGLSIGCVVNQTLSTYYLTSVDRYVKEVLKCKYFCRYMDDIICLSTDKKELEKMFIQISLKINELDLEVNPKSNIYKLNNGFTFLGKTYSILNNKLYIKTKNDTYNNAIRSLSYKRKNDFSKYYLSKMSYYSILDKERLISLEEEYEYLKTKYNCLVVLIVGTKYLFDKTNKLYFSYKEQNKIKDFIKYICLSNSEYILLYPTKVIFNNI